MKKVNLFSGAFVIVAGLLIAFGPQSIFHVCKSDGDMVMRCFYTARAELGIGIELVLLGVFLLLQKTKEARIATAVGISLSSVLAFLIPNFLIGVCGAAHMHCKAVAQPALTLISTLTLVVSIISIFFFEREQEDVSESYNYQEAGN